MHSPDRLRALLAKPGLVVMPAVWDGLSAKLAAAAGFETARKVVDTKQPSNAMMTRWPGSANKPI